MGFAVLNGAELKKQRLPEELQAVRENIEIHYNESETLLRDADVVIYNPKTSQVAAIISSKTSLRERVVQTVYWKFKLLTGEKSQDIKMYLVTSDTDNSLKAKRHRVIAEANLDGTYVLTAEDIEETEKIKLFEHFIDDLKHAILESQ